MFIDKLAKVPYVSLSLLRDKTELIVMYYYNLHNEYRKKRNLHKVLEVSSKSIKELSR